MKVLTRKQFMQTPRETVFSYFAEISFTDLMIKTSDINDSEIDFDFDDIVGAVESEDSGDFFDKCMEMKSGASKKMDFNYTGRDGMFDEDQMYAVYEKEDVVKLIERLKKCV